jgi:hypothetical protein
MSHLRELFIFGGRWGDDSSEEWGFNAAFQEDGRMRLAVRVLLALLSAGH